MTRESQFSEFSQHNKNMSLLLQAQQAERAGDRMLAIHLYLAAAQNAHAQSANASGIGDNTFVRSSLEAAWELALDLKARSIAEHIFDLLQVYIQPQEVPFYVAGLEKLTLDKLQEIGLTEHDLQDITRAIEQEISQSDDSSAFKFMSQSLGDLSSLFSQANAQEQSNSTQNNNSAPETAKSLGHVRDTAKAQEQESDDDLSINLAQNNGEKHDSKASVKVKLIGAKKISDKQGSRSIQEKQAPSTSPYDELVSYDNALMRMRDLGIGSNSRPAFLKLKEELKAVLGVDGLAQDRPFVFTGSDREDINRFVGATVAELGLPSIRMTLEENASMGSIPMLCVMASPDLNQSRFAMPASYYPAVLVLEDFDLWAQVLEGVFALDEAEIAAGKSYSKQALETLGMIRFALKNPHTCVLISLESIDNLPEQILDMIESPEIINIENPTVHERHTLWQRIATEHPHFKSFNLSRLVRLTNGMSRSDIINASYEMVQDAYRKSLDAHHLVSFGEMDLIEKMAAYMPLESKEYQEVEDLIVQNFMTELNESHAV